MDKKISQNPAIYKSGFWENIIEDFTVELHFQRIFNNRKFGHVGFTNFIDFNIFE